MLKESTNTLRLFCFMKFICVETQQTGRAMGSESTSAKEDQLDRRLYVVSALNACFIGLTLWAWSLLYPLVAAPLRWGTGQIVPSHPDALDYPYAILWGLPMMATLVALVLRREGQRPLAILVAAAPLLFLIVLIVVFNVLPVR